jgi:hypothetical protein
MIVTGLRFWLDGYDLEMAGVGVFCSTPTLVRGANSYSVQLSPSPGPSAQFYGTYEDGSLDDQCDTTQFQVAWDTLMNTDSFDVNGLGMNCGAGTLTLDGSNHLTITFSNLSNRFGHDYGGGTEYEETCGSNQALVGFNGKYDVWLHRIQPVCAPLNVTYK